METRRPRSRTRIATTVASAMLLGVSCTVGFPGARDESRLAFQAAPGSPYLVGRRLGPPVIGDVNGDGFSDVAVTCKPEADARLPAAVILLLGDGTGAFRELPPVFTTPLDGLKLDIGDFDEDQKLDLCVAAHDSYEVTLLKWDGEGGLRKLGEPVLTVRGEGHGPHTHSVALHDTNRDGHLDLLTTNADDDTLSVLLGDGTGQFSFAAGSPFPAGSHPYEGLTMVDVNRDGYVDAVVPNLFGNTVSVLLGDGRGSFRGTEGSPISVRSRPGFVAVGDLDGDGSLEIIVTHDDDPHLLWLKQRNGSWESAGLERLSEPVWTAVVADMDGDGCNDVVVGGIREQVLILLGGPRGRWPVSTVALSDCGPSPGYVAIADLDGDGKLDLVTGSFTGGGLHIQLAQ